MKTTLLFALLFAAVAYASPVTVTLEGTGGVSNGSVEVLPYYLSINNKIIAGDCFDIFDEMSIGQTWEANIDTLQEAVSGGRFSTSVDALHGYELVGVLSADDAPTAQDQIDLQEAIWNVFDPGHFAVNPNMTAYIVGAELSISIFDFNTVRFVEPTNAGIQDFVIENPPSLTLTVVQDTPEPITFLLVSAGLLAVGLRSRICRASGDPVARSDE